MKHLKQHYLNHSKEVRAGPETEVGLCQAVEEEKNVEREAGVLLQENSISSSDSSREAAHPEQPSLARPEVETDNVSQHEESKVDISTSDNIKEVAELNSSTDLPPGSEKVKCHIKTQSD